MASSTFSSAVRNGMRLSDCRTMPIRSARKRARPASSSRSVCCPPIADPAGVGTHEARRSRTTVWTCRCPIGPASSWSPPRRGRGRLRPARGEHQNLTRTTSRRPPGARMVGRAFIDAVGRSGNSTASRNGRNVDLTNPDMTAAGSRSSGIANCRHVASSRRSCMPENVDRAHQAIHAFSIGAVLPYVPGLLW